MEPIYIYKTMPNDLDENGDSLIDWLDPPEITRSINQQFSFYGSYFIDGSNAEFIKKGNWIKALCPDMTWQYFKIKTAVKNLHSVSVNAMHIGYEANRNFIINSYTANGDGAQIMTNLKSSLSFKQPFEYKSTITHKHQFTVKETNPIDAIIGQNNGNQNLTGVVKGELDMNNYNLILKDQMGNDNGYRIDLGVNLESVTETIDDLSIINSLYLIGGEPDDKQYDDGLPPVTYKYLEIKGVTDDNRRIGKRENSDCKTVQELKDWGQSLFEKDRIHEPKISQEVNMISLESTIEYQELYGDIAKLQLGDTVYCTVDYMHLEIVERMIEYVWFPTFKKYKSVVLGNDLGMFTNNVQTQISEAKKELQKATYELTESIIQATELINGVQGGSVLQYPKNYPHTTYYMDTDSTDTAKNVIAINNAGIGFSTTGWRGPFKNAWTIDGVLNADFIKAGILEGVLVRSVKPNGDGKIELNDGGVNFFDQTSGKEYGSISPSSSSKTGGISIHPAKGCYVDINDGYGSPIINIPEDSNHQQPLLNTTGKHTHKGDLYIVGKLFLNGREITPGTGGSPGGDWNGQYPSEVKTSAEKFAWEAWVTLLSLGYSKAAAAGILGNINGEAGPSMNPDTEQIGGPAYGAVQHDGSAYPLIGAPTNNGREYFQRLHKASGAGGNYREMAPQMKVVNWAMTNGQWIGAVNPTSVSGFKGMTSPEQAAYVFEKNYERPANAHPERQGYARNWYDKFVNLQIVSNNWTKPLRVGYVVTQEWDVPDWNSGGAAGIHGGIDLAPTGGGNPPVYAAKGGTVETATFDGTGGNYVVVNHGDGYWTYYGHMTGINVSVGQKVDTNTVLGPCGATGAASGVHLHFEVWKGGRWQRVNPRSVIKF